SASDGPQRGPAPAPPGYLKTDENIRRFHLSINILWGSGGRSAPGGRPTRLGPRKGPYLSHVAAPRIPRRVAHPRLAFRRRRAEGHLGHAQVEHGQGRLVGALPVPSGKIRVFPCG